MRRSRKTVARALNLARQIEVRKPKGLSQQDIEEIVAEAKYGATVSLAGAIFVAWQRWSGQRDAEPDATRGGNGAYQGAEVEVYIERETRRLIALADKMRQAIENPQLDIDAAYDLYFDGAQPRYLCLPGGDWSLNPYFDGAQPRYLCLPGGDWSLNPSDWVALVTPAVDDAWKWGADFPRFAQVTASSPFWRRLKALQRMGSRFNEDLSRAASLKESHPAFWKSWESWQAAEAWSVSIERTLYEPKPAWGQASPSYGAGRAARVCELFFFGPMPNIYRRQRAMVWQLQRIWEAFTPGAIEQVICRNVRRLAAPSLA